MAIIADEEQLEALARLRFEPRGTDELGALVMAHAEAKPWLVAGVRRLLAERAAGDRTADCQEDADLSLSLSASSWQSAVLSPELKAGAGKPVLSVAEVTALVTEFTPRAQESHADLIVAVGQGDAQTRADDARRSAGSRAEDLTPRAHGQAGPSARYRGC
ncbi:MAG: hypothetical protein MAG451_02112 [Anaerolineales bacterium]|nr:hypothetical protein [Anaerolineales bacterium]